MRAERRTGSGREPEWREAAGRAREEAASPHDVRPPPSRGVVAVFPSRVAAERAAAAVSAQFPAAAVQVGGDRAHVASLRAEMAEEEARSYAGTGVGLYTKEMARGAFWGVAVWSIVTAVLALPFALIPMGDLSIGARLAIVAIVGAFAGGSFGFVAGGGAGAKGPAEPMAAEEGVTLYVGVTPGEEAERAARTLAEADAIRIDEFHDSRPDRRLEIDVRDEPE